MQDVKTTFFKAMHVLRKVYHFNKINTVYYIYSCDN